MFVILWLVMSAVSFSACSYMKGRTEKRMTLDNTYFSEVPWGLGQVASLVWPLILLGGGFWYLNHFFTNLGAGKGVAINTELHELRDLGRKVSEQQEITYRMLAAKNIDPENIDDNTKRLLNAAAIRWSMEQEIYGSRALTDGHEKEDIVMDILDASGAVVEDRTLKLEANLFATPSTQLRKDI